MNRFARSHRDRKVPSQTHVARDRLHAQHINPVMARREARKPAAAIKICVGLRYQITSLRKVERTLLKSTLVLGRDQLPFYVWIDIEEFGLNSLNALRRVADIFADSFLLLPLLFHKLRHICNLSLQLHFPLQSA